VKLALLDASAAALNQDDQHNDEENTGGNLNDRGRVHLKSSFFEQHGK